MSALTLLAGLVAIVVFTWAVYVFARFITGYPSHRADAWERRELRGEKTVSQTVERESVADIVDEHRDVFGTVANGDDGAAELARNILAEAEADDG